MRTTDYSDKYQQIQLIYLSTQDQYYSHQYHSCSQLGPSEDGALKPVLSPAGQSSHGRSDSIFGDAYEQQVLDSLDGEDVDKAEELLAISRLTAVVEECNYASEMLNNETIASAKRREIRDEIVSIKHEPGFDIASAVVDEFEAYEQRWQRHIDILVRQEADLFEQVSCYGYDVRALPVYASAAVEPGDFNSVEEQQYAAANQKFASLKNARLTAVRKAFESSRAVDTKLSGSVEYVEEVCEEDSDQQLPTRQALADGDEALRKYADMPDIDPALFPPSFTLIQPMSVLKALFHGSVTSPEIVAVIERYDVPRHVVLIMSTARMIFPRTTNYWSFAGRVHPSVRRALYHSASLLDQVHLCDHYKLPEEMCSVTDFGDAEDICDIFHERKRREAAERVTRRARQQVEQNEVDEQQQTEDEVNDHADEVNPEVLNSLLLRENEISQKEQSVLLKEARIKDQKTGQKAAVHFAKTVGRLVIGRQLDDGADDCEILEQREVNVLQAGVRMNRHNRSNRNNQKREEKERGREEGKKRRARSSSATSQSGALSQCTIDIDVSQSVPAVSPESAHNTVETEEEEGVEMAVDDDVVLLAVTVIDDGEAVNTADEVPDESVVSVTGAVDLNTLDVQAGVETLSVDKKEEGDSNSDDESISFVRRSSSSKGRAIGDITGADTSDEEESGVVGVRRFKSASQTDSLAHSSGGDTKASASKGIAAGGTGSHHDTIDLTLSDEEEGGEVKVVGKAAAKIAHSDGSVSTNFSSSDEGDDSNSEGEEKEGGGKKSRGKLIKKNPKTAPLPRRSVRNMPSALSESEESDSDATALEEDEDEQHSTSFSSDEEEGGECEEVVDEDTGARYFVPSPARTATKKAVIDDDDDVVDVTQSYRKTTAATSSSNGSATKSGTLASWFSASAKPASKSPAVKPPLSGGGASGSKGVPAFFNSAKSNNYNLKDISSGGGDNNGWLSTSRAAQVRLTDAQLNAKYFTAAEDDKDSLQLNADLHSQHKPVLVVSELVSKLKDHQKEGLAFIWRNVLENSYYQLTREKGERHNKKADNGCVLAHCMGLGKTFTIIAFVVTMLTNPVITALVDSYQPPEEPDTKKTPLEMVVKSSASSSSSVPRPPKRLIQSVLIIAPLVTLENWTVEFKKWTPADLQPHSRVVFIDANLKSKERLEVMRKWHLEGGVMVIGYTMLRLHTTAAVKGKASIESSTMMGVSSVSDAAASLFGRKNAVKPVVSDEVAAACRYLLDPGPDLVIADEAHQLSNNKSKISLAFNRMRTKRRIALTGSPLQNNLVEYWCMVDWVKHHHLYSQNRFKELFVKPIAAGDKDDAGPYEVKEMRKKVHVLNKNLRNIVNRKDFSILTASLKMKRQFVLVIHMTNFQQFLYRTFLAKLMAISGTVKLFKTYQCFLRLWNHPCCTVAQTLYAKQMAENKKRQLLAAGQSKKKQSALKSVPPPTLIPLSEMKKELSVTFNYFKVHGKRLLAELQSSTKAVEDALLKPTAGIEDLAVCDEDGEGDNENEDDENMSLSFDNGLLDEDLLEGSDRGVKRSLSASTLDDQDPLDDVEKDCEDEGGAERKRVRTGEETFNFAPIGGVADPLKQSILPSLSCASSDSYQPTGGLNSGRTTPNTSTAPSTLSLDWWKHVPEDVSDKKPAIDASKSSCGGHAMMDLTGDDEKVGDDLASLSRLMSSRDLVHLSNKMVTFLSLLALSVLKGDKVLVFSQSLYTLDVIETFLKMTQWADDLLPQSADPAANTKKFSNWYNGKDYLRIDGKTKDRQVLIDRFNNDTRQSFKLFMVCTKAGNMGINLYTANRVVIFDSSWNPVHDLQAISRAYRYGQQKEVFVYRLVAAGSMEEVIY
eukprot:gene24492-30843_t